MTGLILHLEQSTVFTAVAALLAIALKNKAARVRYWVWMAASVKFLVPFSLLISLGASLAWRAPSLVAPAQVVVMVDHVSQPAAVAATAAPEAATRASIAILPVALWLFGSVFLLIYWARHRARIGEVIGASPEIDLGVPLRARSSPAAIEPGIFGIFRPVLWLPRGLEKRLTREQLQSILAHELCHARRRDNLTAAIHMLVEAIFWFHPLVWWIGARLIEERERACDEAVLAAGNDRDAYAEGILKVCRFYLESPLACAAGVTGADLKKRIGSILRAPVARDLSARAKSLLAAAALLAVFLPVGLGVFAPRLRAQSLFTTPYNGPGFEVASIKPNQSGDRGSGIPPAQGGRFRALNVTTRQLLGYAYQTQSHARIGGGPSWLDADRYDVNAKAAANLPEAKLRPMVLKLLEDRFALKFHAEAKQMQAYILSVAKNGPKFEISHTCKPDPKLNWPCGGFRVQNRRYVGGQQVSAADLAEVLEELIGQPVIDHTGIDGVFNVQLEWTPDERQSPGGDAGVAAPDTDKPSLYVAIQEQLGLRLDLKKTTVDAIVVDSASKPSAN
ncbi:MAG TPA: M56 family metallopeptidase [Bryobacteraceae bacterium]|nr:M56 family metallopeptidase [Bryobacteraceae bacterium]